MSMDLIDRAKCFGAGFAVALLCAAVAWSWSTYKPRLPSVLAPTSPKVDDIKTEPKDCTTVQAFKSPAKQKLDLPAHVQKDEQASVIAAAPIPPSDYPRTATAVLHRDTGIGEIYLHDDPLPWISLNYDRRWRATVLYGVRDDSASIWRGTVDYSIARIKALEGVANVQVDSDGRRFAGVGLSLKF